MANILQDRIASLLMRQVENACSNTSKTHCEMDEKKVHDCIVHFFDDIACGKCELPESLFNIIYQMMEKHEEYDNEKEQEEQEEGITTHERKWRNLLDSLRDLETSKEVNEHILKMFPNASTDEILALTEYATDASMRQHAKNLGWEHEHFGKAIKSIKNKMK